ncbi:MAG: hypothetical protein ACRELF_24240 [Gemmataceae bacterium]
MLSRRSMILTAAGVVVAAPAFAAVAKPFDLSSFLAAQCPLEGLP